MQNHMACWNVKCVKLSLMILTFFDFCFIFSRSADSDHLPVTVSEFTERMAILRSSMDEGLDDEYSVSGSYRL